MALRERVERRWRLLFFCLTASFMTTLDATIVVVALPSIGRSLQASTSQLQWVVSGYALAFGVVPIIAGRLGDDLGRRRMLLLGTAAFLITSALVGLAPTPKLIIMSRITQGLAAGIINPQISGIVQQLFAPEERGSAFSMVGVSNSIALAGGPALGGAIVYLGGPDLGWRLLFFTNLPLGIVSLVVCSLQLPADPPADRARVDFVGLGLLTLTLLGLLFPAVQYDSGHDPRLFLLLAPAAALGYGFIRWEARLTRAGGPRLVELDLFRVKSFVAGLEVGLLFFAAFGAAPLVLALYLQDGLGYSPGRSGLIAAAYAIGSVLSGPVAGRLVRRHGRRITLYGLAILGLGFCAMAAVVEVFSRARSTAEVGFVLIAPLVVAGLGGGCVGSPNQALTLMEVDVRRGSMAGGMLQTAQRVGSAVGVVAVSTVFYLVSRRDGGERRASFDHAFTVSMVVVVIIVLAAGLAAAADARRGGTRLGNAGLDTADPRVTPVVEGGGRS